MELKGNFLGSQLHNPPRVSSRTARFFFRRQVPRRRASIGRESVESKSAAVDLIIAVFTPRSYAIVKFLQKFEHESVLCLTLRCCFFVR